jgi:hypothetical protein
MLVIRELEEANWFGGPINLDEHFNSTTVRYCRNMGELFYRIQVDLGISTRVSSELTTYTPNGRLLLAGNLSYCSHGSISIAVNRAKQELEEITSEKKLPLVMLLDSLNCASWSKAANGKMVYRRKTRSDGLVEEIRVQDNPQGGGLVVESFILQTTNLSAVTAIPLYSSWRRIHGRSNLGYEVFRQTMNLNQRSFHSGFIEQ